MAVAEWKTSGPSLMNRSRRHGPDGALGPGSHPGVNAGSRGGMRRTLVACSKA
jgi:hypothetical protein